MNKFDKICVKYSIFSIPLILTVLIWGSISDPDLLSQGSGLQRLAWDFLGYVLMIWIVVSFYITIKTVFSSSFREYVLSKITRIKERDEREVEISGSAAKFSFFSTLAVAFLLLFLSLFTVTIGKHPETNNAEDKRGYISIGMKFKPYSIESQANTNVEDKGEVIVDYKDFPLTNAGVLLFLILWQVGSYHLVVRKKLYSM